MSAKKSAYLSTLQSFVLVVLRIVIGWHFLYEGIVKLTSPGWTSAAFLSEAKWLFADKFHWIAANPDVLKIVDLMNIWGLILIGLGLVFGMFTRLASIAGILLLVLYYIANPPLAGLGNGLATEGNYLVIDKNFVEMIALLVLAVFPAPVISLDRYLAALRYKRKTVAADVKQPQDELASTGASLVARRELLKNLVMLPVLGGFIFAWFKKRGWESYEEKNLLSMQGDASIDAQTSATLKTLQFSSLKDLKGQLPYGQIGNLKISRLFLGGNLIGGWAHARDLIYVSKLVQSYHTDQKVFDTFHIAEQCGINTILTNPQLCRVINKYWRQEKGKIQFISDCGYKGDAIEGVKISVDGGAHACYVQGGIADQLVLEGKLDIIAKALELTRQNGLPAGIGAHQLETVKACVDNGLKPDFWVKTLHHTNYWSANKENQFDNIWCVNPEETIAYMNNLPEPWIAFKTLAAGAILPAEGFQYAFNNGADFVCVGMYDFQIVDDVNIALDALANIQNRQRPWYS
ncbi:MAG TPA: DoxX family protein [bacterium]|nr:DoxX family protein [bacterium]HPN43456.1 DoxX family protein [bacterium]